MSSKNLKFGTWIHSLCGFTDARLLRGGHLSGGKTSLRLDTESSKLLLLTPHNDSVKDLEDFMGTPAGGFPPTLYECCICTLYQNQYVPHRLDEFAVQNHMGIRPPYTREDHTHDHL